MYHNFFIHSSSFGYLGCFYVLAVVNSAVMNTEVHVSSSVKAPPGYMPGIGISGPRGSFIPSF